MKTKKRELEDWEKQECAALKAAITAYNASRPKGQRVTQAMAASELGIEQGSFSNYLNGRLALNEKIAVAVWKLFGIPAADYSPRLAGDLASKGEAIIDGARSNITEGPDIRGRFPLISWVAAGAWSDISEIHPSEATLYPCPVNCSERTFVLRVQGISMEPLFRDGDLIFVDPAAEWRHGAYVVARLDDHNEATFKQLVIEGGQKYLKPLNPNWPEQIIPINGNCTIVGPVVFSGRAF